MRRGVLFVGWAVAGVGTAFGFITALGPLFLLPAVALSRTWRAASRRSAADRPRLYARCVAIRRATDADANTLRELWEAFTAEASYTPYPAHPFTPALLTDHTVLVADDGGEITGTLYLNTANAGFGFVFGVYVAPEARRRGIAEALVRAAARVLRDDGRPYLVLSVDTPNDAARALYAKLGFVDQARTLRADVGDLL